MAPPDFYTNLPPINFAQFPPADGETDGNADDEPANNNGVAMQQQQQPGGYQPPPPPPQGLH
jgi:hypothetical protein